MHAIQFLTFPTIFAAATMPDTGVTSDDVETAYRALPKGNVRNAEVAEGARLALTNGGSVELVPELMARLAAIGIQASASRIKPVIEVPVTPWANILSGIAVLHTADQLRHQFRKSASGMPVQSYEDTLANMVKAGIVPADTSLTPGHTNGRTGFLNADGTITVGDTRYDSPSKAAKASHPNTASGDKVPEINGWKYWSFDGRKLASLRRN